MSFSEWFSSVRPKTLVAAIIPVMTGGGLAYAHGSFDWLISSAALLCALLIQIGTNLANDYFDFLHGADTSDRVGFERATAAGKVRPGTMLNATLLTFGLSFLTGLYLVWHGGWIVLLIGVVCILCGLAYTGGPYPLAYNGLGDLFVFLFFGPVAVAGTFYVNTLSWSSEPLWASLAVGALCTNILVVNNLRDVDTDARAGKNTLGVIFGEAFLRLEYFGMLLLAYAIPPHFYFREEYSLFIFLPFLSLPFAVNPLRSVLSETNKVNLNRTLEQTARLMTLFGILFAAGIVAG